MAEQTIRFVIRADSTQGIAAVEKMSDALKGMGGFSEQAGKASESAFGGLVGTVGKIGAAIGAYKIGEKLLEIGKNAVTMASDAVESENLFSVSMGNMEQAARKWSEEVGKALGINEYELRKNVATFNVMFNSMGMGEKASYGMAKGLTQLSYDMASFYNLKPEEAFNKLRAGISGEIEPLKSLGLVLNQATVETYAYTHGIAQAGEKLTEQEKITARYGLIMEQTAKAQGDMARTIDSPANAMRVLGSRFDEIMVKLGEAFLPTLQVVLGVIGDFVKGLDLSGGSLKTLAQWLAYPVQGFMGLIMAVDKAGEAVYGMAASFLEAMQSVNRTLGVLSPFKSKMAEIDAAIVSFRDKQKQSAEASDYWWKKIQDVQKGVDQFGQSTKSVTPEVERLKAAQEAAAQASAKQKEEIEKTREAADKLLKPMEGLVTEFQAWTKAGYSANDFVAAHREEIIKAAAKQTDMGKALSDSAVKLLELALNAEFARKSTSALTADTNRLETATWDLVISEKELRKEREKNQNWLDNATAKAPVWDPKDDPLLKPILRTQEEYMKLPGIAEKAGKDSREGFLNQVSTIATDFSKKIADGITSGQLSIMSAIKELGNALLRALTESFVTPFIGNLVGAFKGLLGGEGFGGFSLGNLFSGIFGGGGGAGGGGSSPLGSFNLGGLFSKGGLLGGIGSLFGIGGGSTAAAGTIAIPGVYTLGAGVGAGAGAGAGGGAGMLAGGGSGSMMGSLGAFFTNPWTIGIGAALAAGLVGYKMFTQDAYEAGSKEVTRDLGVTGISESKLKSFWSGLGLSEKEAYGIRLDLLTSPKFLTEIVAPLAETTGQMDVLLGKLSSVKTVMGTVDLAGPFREFMETGDADALNKAWTDLFSKSQALVGVLPEYATLLAATSTAQKEVADTADSAAESLGRTSTTARDAGSGVASITDEYNQLGISARQASNLLDGAAESFGRASIAATGAQVSIDGIRTGLERATSSVRDYGNAVASVMMGNAFGISFYTTPTRTGIEGVTASSGGSSISSRLTDPGVSGRAGVDGSGGSSIGALVPRLDTGGQILESGIAVVHKGETVVPAGRGGLTVQVNINGQVLANDIEGLIAEGVTRVYRSGGFDFMAR